MAKVDVIVEQHRARDEQVLIAHHQPTWQYAKASVKDAHVDVHFKGRYTLALKKGLCIGDHGDVGCAQ